MPAGQLRVAVSALRLAVATSARLLRSTCVARRLACAARPVYAPAPVPAPSCGFPLDASVEEISLFGPTERLALSNHDQTGTYTFTGGGEAGAFAAPTGFATGDAAGFPLAAGKKVVQLRLTVPVLTGGGSGPASQANGYIGYYDAGEYVVLAGASMTGNANGTYALLIAGFNGGTRYSAAFASNTVLLTFEFDCDANTMAVKADGAPLTLSTGFFPGSVLGANAVPLSLAGEGAATNPADAGKAASVQWITAAAEMTGAISSGYTDVCDNPIEG